MTPGFDEAVVEIKNDDGRYQIIHVCTSLFHLGFWCDTTYNYRLKIVLRMYVFHSKCE